MSRASLTQTCRELRANPAPDFETVQEPAEAYLELIQRKLDEWTPCGVTVDAEDIHPRLFDFQRAIVQWAAAMGRAAIFADCGLGKGLLPGCEILTPHGFRKLMNLKVGDRVIGSNGKPCTITGYYPRNTQPCYRVTFCDGTSTICDSEHLWNVKSHNDKKRGKGWRTMSTAELASTSLHYGKQRSRTWHIPLTMPVEFEGKPLSVDPYVLGVLLGDGALSGDSIRWTNHDPEIADEVGELVGAGVSVRRNGEGWSIASDIVGHGHSNHITSRLREMGVMGKLSFQKEIPEDYLFATIPDRVALLQGLMDTDGYSGETPELSSASEKLARQVVFLVQSLGGTARICCKESPTYTHNGEHRIGRPSWRVTMSLDNGINPFRLARKASKFKPPSRGVGRWIDSIEKVEDRQTICIKVDSPDELFVIHDCIVTHNTSVQLEWARLVAPGGIVIIFAPLTVAEQTIEEAALMGMTVTYAADKSGITGPGVYITNYERCEKFAGIEFSAVVLDESGILKNFNGKTRTALIERFRSTPYRLCCTATPAPNDITELANHAEFLGIKSRVEMLATFFIHDDEGWRLKGHATREFYRWLSSWAVYLRTPADIGFDGSSYVLPELRLHDEVVSAEVVPEGHLFPVEMSVGVVGRSALRKATLVDRVSRVVELVSGNDDQWLIWVGLNDESEAIRRAIPDAVTVEGSDTLEDRLAALRAFKSGAARVLISKPKVSGFGINFQHCHRMVFCGINDSWEQYYQAIRRCWRFGQRHPVDVHIVSSNSEAAIVANVKNKEEQARIMGEQIIEHVGALNVANLSKSAKREITPGVKDVARGDKWELWNGDCVEVLRDQIPADSVDLSVYSPPFATLFTYSDDIRDMGNNRDHDAFFEQFGFFVSEMLRVTKPGRLTCVHVQQLTTRKNTEGHVGLKDFRGRVIEEYRNAGWIHFGETVIRKCPQALRDGTPVLTPTGWKAIESLSVGDRVIGSNGWPTTVLGVWPQGERPLYRVTTCEGDQVDCDGEHLWNVRSQRATSKGLEFETWKTKDLVAYGLKSPSNKRRFELPQVQPVNFAPQEKPLPIHPYTLGALLGDGMITERASVGICSDPEVVARCPIPADHQWVPRASREYARGVAVYQVTCNRWHENDVLDSLRKLGVQGCRSWEKFIPEDYRLSSIGERRELLRGLLDTDGKINKRGGIWYHTTSERLADDVRFLVNSLGGRARVTSSEGGKYECQGESRTGRTMYNVSISLCGSWNPFTVPHKAERWTDSRRQNRLMIESIEPVDTANCTCITVAAQDGLFVTKDFVVTHNSQAIRTKAHSLMFVTFNKDRANSRPCLVDYVLVFKKPGENAVPIVGDLDNDTWIKWADAIWSDIRESDTLNTKAAKSEADEKHICPLQLPVIERCVRLWSNPGEHILSPFAGIGSEGHEAIRLGRRFTGIELKPEYWQQAQLNIQRAEHVTDNELSIFSDEELSA